jgi:hypothetical protein
MPTYLFEIQNGIKTSVVADNKTAARVELIDNLASFADDMINDCVISEGECCD